MFVREGVAFGGQELTIETGRMAKQADGSVVIRYGDSMVLVTAVAATVDPPGDRLHAADLRVPREDLGRRQDPRRLLQARGASDRGRGADLPPHRPPQPARCSPRAGASTRQVIATVLSADRENPTDVLAMTGASTALHLSDIPWAGPFAGVRVGRVDGEFVVNPTFAQREESELDLVVAASRDAIVMVEGGAAEVAEDDPDRRADVRPQGGPAAHRPAGEAAGGGGQAQARVRAAGQGPGHRRAGGRRRPAPRSRPPWPSGTSRSATPRSTPSGSEAIEALKAEFPEREAELKEAYESAKKKHLRELVLDTGRRIDGRATTDIRQITCEVGRAAAHPRLVAVHPRRDPGAGDRHAGHQAGRAAHRGADRTRSRSASCCTTTSRRSPPARPSRCAAPAAARSATATWPSGRWPGCCRRRRTSPTPSASSRRSSSPTAARRWPRSAAARCR